MKNVNLKILLPLMVLCIILLAVSLRQNTAISNFPMTETALWNSAEYTIPATQTQSFISTVQSWTATPTLRMPPTWTSTPTPTPATLPPPTATFPVITLMTSQPLDDIYLSGKVLTHYTVLDLSKYHFDTLFQIDPRKDLYEGAWSGDGDYLAIATYLRPLSQDVRFTDLGVCILRKQDINENVWKNFQGKAKCIRIYTSIKNPRSITQGDYAEIENISWSPDNKYLLVTVKGLDTAQYIITSPCMIEIDTSSVDCRWAYLVDAKFTAYKIVTGAHAISWSPKDENKLAIPLKTNWYPESEGAENGHAPSNISRFPWYAPTDDLKQGLYLVDTDPLVPWITDPLTIADVITLLWESPPNTTIDPDQLPLWTSDGKQIAFVYMDPWFNVERNPRYPNIPTANYSVGMIGEDGQNFQKLFDSTSMYLSGVLPSDSSIPAIKIHRWLYQDRFILFTAHVYRSIEDKYKQSLFLYDTETKQFFQLTTWADID